MSDRPSKDDDLDALAERFHAGESEARPLDDDADLEELRSTALARRLAQRRGYSIAGREPKPRRLLSSWGLGGVMLLALWSLYGTLPDLKYWLSTARPVDLGHLGGYQLDNAREGMFAHVEGIASPKRASYSRFFTEHELVPLIASRILVDRAQPPDDSMRGFGFQYSGEGRLVLAAAGSRWDAVREQFVAAGELAHSGDVWLLEEGVSPHKGFRIPFEVGGWSLIFLACAATLAVRLRRRMVG